MTEHRYNGMHKHPTGKYSWCCTCDSDGAVQWTSHTQAELDYRGHQQTMIEAGEGDRCDWCDTVTDDLTGHDGHDLCLTCHVSALPRAEAEYYETATD